MDVTANIRPANPQIVNHIVKIRRLPLPTMGQPKTRKRTTVDSTNKRKNAVKNTRPNYYHL